VEELISFFSEKKLTAVNTKSTKDLPLARIYLVVNPIRQFKKRIKVPKKSLLSCIQTEQIYNNSDLGFDFFYRYNSLRSFKKILSRFDLIFDFSPNNTRYLSQIFKRVQHFHYGYSNKMDYFDQKIEKKYDIIFVGSSDGLNNRRKIILDQLKSLYNVYPTHDNLWGKNLYTTIQECKICINLHFDDSLTFEAFRFVDYLSNKGFVLSDFVADSSPYVSGTDYIQFDSSNLIELLEYYLNNDIERDKVAYNGYLKARNNPIKTSINNLYNHLLINLIDINKPKLILKIKYTVMRMFNKLKIILKFF